jgi:hypothetical protein
LRRNNSRVWLASLLLLSPPRKVRPRLRTLHTARVDPRPLPFARTHSVPPPLHKSAWHSLL